MTAANDAAKKMEADRIPDWKLAYRLDEAAATLGIGLSTVKLRIRQKRLTAKKDGSATIIERDEIRRYLAALPEARPTARGTKR